MGMLAPDPHRSRRAAVAILRGALILAAPAASTPNRSVRVGAHASDSSVAKTDFHAVDPDF
jgi:hypothetical protein